MTSTAMHYQLPLRREWGRAKLGVTEVSGTGKRPGLGS